MRNQGFTIKVFYVWVFTSMIKENSVYSAYKRLGISDDMIKHFFSAGVETRNRIFSKYVYVDRKLFDVANALEEHSRGPDVPGHTLRGWRFSQSPARRLVTDPLSDEAGGPASLCLRCVWLSPNAQARSVAGRV